MTLTNKDIEKLAAIFVTKQDFIDRLNGGLAGLKSELTDQILTSQDKIIKRLDDISTEHRMSRLEPRRHEDKLDDHEKRIKTLEVAKA